MHLQCSTAGSDRVLREFLNSRRTRARYISTLQPSATPGQGLSRGSSSAKPLRYYSLTRSLSRQVTIQSVSDEVLLDIFRYFLDVSPRDWPRLVHTCRKWRRIALASQGMLHLQLFCTHGTPVKKSLDCWPTLPIVVQYGGLPTLGAPTPEDEDNIMVALKQPDRVVSISLTITPSLLKKLLTIKGAFSELQGLVLCSRDCETPTMPSSFRWGQSLRRLHSTRVAFPALLQLLSSSTNIIDLQLHEVFFPWQFSPEMFTKTLSKLGQLRSLSLHFRSPTFHHFSLPRYLPVCLESSFFPVLTRLNYQGSMEYLEDTVTSIDAPFLKDIEITFFDNLIVAHSKLSKFIDCIELYRSHFGAHILSSQPTISISITQPGSPTCLKLQVLCKPSCLQTSSMAQICLFDDEDNLPITTTRPSGRMNISCSKEFLELLNKFTGKKLCQLDMNCSINVVHTLQPLGSQHEKCPALHKLYILQPGPRDAVLRETVVSFMTSRRLSGHPIEVEYERLNHINEHETGTSIIYPVPLSNRFVVGPFPGQLTIEVLSDDTLLSIFRHYLDSDAAPRIWPTLVWVCRRWRQIVFASPLGLNLRLYSTHGTPVLKSLDCWPALPVIIKYGGVPNLDPPAPGDNDNIIAALKQSGRVSSISLTVTSSLREKLSAISEPFMELEEFVLCSQDNLQLSFPSSFHLGPRLRTLHLIRTAIPSFPRLLSPSQALVDIQLHEIPITGYFSPEEFASALSGTTQIRSLSLHFLSLPPRRNYLSMPPPSGERVVLPTLACLKYRGTSKYLDSFVARIDAPRLSEINITFFYQPTMDASQLGQFIERTEIQPLQEALRFFAKVEISADAISISFDRSSAPSADSLSLQLQISCKQLNWQLSCMAQVCDQVSPFLYRVSDLEINTAQPLGGQDDGNSEQWLDLLRSFKFSRAKFFAVDSEVTTDVLRVLGPANERNTTMLPSLCLFYVQEHMEMVGPLWDSMQSFVTSRWISGRPVEVEARFYQCHICHGRSEEPQGLKRHLREKHGYQVLCSYCGEFECTPGQSDLFQEHLEDTHPEIAHNDALISEPSLTITQMNDLVNQHTSLRAPNVVPPSPTPESTELHSPLPMYWDSDLVSDGRTSDATNDSDSDASDE